MAPSACPRCRRVMAQQHNVRLRQQRICPFVVHTSFFSAAEKYPCWMSHLHLVTYLLTFILPALNIYTFPEFKNNCRIFLLQGKKKNKNLTCYQIPKQNGTKNVEMIKERTVGLSDHGQNRALCTPQAHFTSATGLVVLCEEQTHLNMFYPQDGSAKQYSAL